MSKKNLARSTIEGGRTHYNKDEKMFAAQDYKARTRNYLVNVKKDIDYAETYSEPIREKVSKSFSDKLNPMCRWLHCQVGRLWNDVRSEVHSKFDSRTVAGRHILYDHLLSSVEEVPNLDYHSKNHPYKEEDRITSHYRNSFYVDDDGFLRAKKYIPRRTKQPKCNITSVANWLNGRIIGYVGNKLFWFIPVGKEKCKCEWRYSKYSYGGYYNGLKYLFETIRHEYKNGVIVGSRLEWREPLCWKYLTIAAKQYKQLNKKELEFWNKIPIYYQDQILAWSPTNPNPPKVNFY